MDGVGMGASVCLLWLAALAEEGAVESVSVVVEVDKLLDDDGKAGAEKVLDTTDWTESCELGDSSGLKAAAVAAAVAVAVVTVVVVAVWAVPGVSNITMDT